MNILQRNRSNQLYELAEILSDYEMMRYYSPHYYHWKMSDLNEELQDIYSKSSSRVAFELYGVVPEGVPVEVLAINAASLNEYIKQLENAFKRHTDNFNAVMEQCTPKERQQVKEYLKAGFKEMFEPVFISERLPSYPVIKRVKTELYAIELQQRKDRHDIDEMIRQKEIKQKAKELQRKRERLHRRYGVTTQFTPGYYDEIGTKL